MYRLWKYYYVSLKTKLLKNECDHNFTGWKMPFECTDISLCLIFCIVVLTDHIPLFLLLQLHLVFARPLFPLPSKTVNEDKKPIQTFRPYNIAHRGSNGEIPEETSAAYLVQLRNLEGVTFDITFQNSSVGQWNKMTSCKSIHLKDSKVLTEANTYWAHMW